ncbi:MAG: hypothetical protein ACRDZ2_03330 [Ilumatobacteraceae bacterium]
MISRAVIDASISVADPELLTEALAGYQAQRDALSADLFDVTEEIAGHRWTDDETPGLLLRLSASMNDEIELLAALPPSAPSSGSPPPTEPWPRGGQLGSP